MRWECGGGAPGPGWSPRPPPQLASRGLPSTRSFRMTVLSFVSKSGRDGRRRKGTPARKPLRHRLVMEALEERSLLSANVLQTNLVSDLPGVPQVQDPNLVNPWGIPARGTSAFCISDNNARV